MRGRFLFLMIVTLFFACEDPTTLPVSKVFNGNKLQTAYIDTFSVVTSTVQLDTVLTNNSGTMLLGRYHDDQLGFVSSSTYFQLGYTGSFVPDIRSRFDSVLLILPYNHAYTGDTTNAVNINVYQLTQQMLPRLLPAVPDIKVSGDPAHSIFITTTLCVLAIQNSPTILVVGFLLSVSNSPIIIRWCFNPMVLTYSRIQPLFCKPAPSKKVCSLQTTLTLCLLNFDSTQILKIYRAV